MRWCCGASSIEPAEPLTAEQLAEENNEAVPPLTAEQLAEKQAEAELIAAQILQEYGPVPNEVQQALSPARFIFRALKRQRA